MENHLKITFSSSIDELTSVNSSFDKGILKIAYHGDNRNGSHISKEAFEKSKHTIFNCPVVCRYDRELDQIGSHDVEIVKCPDNSLKIINATHPVGVVPESSNIFWKWFEDDGGGHEYLCAEVFIWKRQEAYERIKNNQIVNQSMEINVKQGCTKDGIFFIDDFEFTAFCLLESELPCFEGASLEMFGLNDFELAYRQMMEDFKASFSEVSTFIEDDIKTKTSMEGGKEALEEKKALLEKYGLTAEQLDFSIEEMTIEELEMKLKEIKDNGKYTTVTNEDFTLNNDLYELLREAVCVEIISNEYGEYPRYCMMDFDVEAHEVYCWDSSDDWKLYGFSYSNNGDNIIIDFDSKKRKKFIIVDFDEGDIDFSLTQVITESSKIISAPELNTITDKYNEASSTIESITQELNELREFKNRIEKEKVTAEIEAVFSMFGDLSGVPAFEELKANHAELSTDEIEEKCFAIRGRQNIPQTFSYKETPPVRIPVGNTLNTEEPYGGLFQEFPPRV